MKKRYFLFILLCFLICFCGEASAKRQWKEHKGRHFVIYYNEAPKDFVDTVEEAAERYYGEISRDLGFRRQKGWMWDERAAIYIYDSSDDYVNAGKQARWSHGSASPKSKVIRTFPAAHGFFDSTLPHELGHIIFREFIGFKASVPQWFEEGVAMYQEKAKRFGSHDIVRKAMSNETFIPLDELSLISLYRTNNQALIGLFYAEAASVVNFLITEFGQHRFVRFCRKLQDGKPFDWALDSVYVRIKDTKKLNKLWVRYLKK